MNETSMHASAPLLKAYNLRRTFNETIALDSCSLSLRPGEIHALVGENGSGKSTLIKILSGIMPPESGRLDWNGAPTQFKTPYDAQQAGIATVFQETLILGELSVRDNVVLGLDPLIRRRRGLSEEVRQAREVLRVLGLEHLHIEEPAGTLSLANRQLIGVARSLLRPWRLLILDESTSALDVEDRDRLFAALKGLRDQGRSILFVSHRMDEIERLADRATVLRSGQSVATLSIGDFGTEKLLDLMSAAGKRKVPQTRAPSACRSDTVVSIRNLRLRLGRAEFNFDLRAGEIMGVAGLEGHGQVAFLECVAGAKRAVSGTVRAERDFIRTPRDAVRNRIGFLPRDRKVDGIFGPLSVTDNVTISSLGALAPLGVFRSATRDATTEAICKRAKVKMQSPRSSMSSLSGGNQQKALLARLMATKPKVLLLNDPLRGVDVGAKHDLYEVLGGLASEGVAILLLSTELAELCLLCHRVAVFHNHALTAMVDRSDLDERVLINAMFGRCGEKPLSPEATP